MRDLADELIERNLAMMRVLPKGTTARQALELEMRGEIELTARQKVLLPMNSRISRL